MSILDDYLAKQEKLRQARAAARQRVRHLRDIVAERIEPLRAELTREERTHDPRWASAMDEYREAAWATGFHDVMIDCHIAYFNQRP